LINKSFFLVLIIFNIYTAKAQFDYDNRITLVTGGITYSAIYDSVNFCSDFIVTGKNNDTIFFKECTERVTSIQEIDLDKNGSNEIIIETFSGGAHCCSSLLIAKVKGNSFRYMDSLYLGNCGYNIDDLNKDGEKEIISCNDMFAYVFTNFSMSRFPITIYSFSDGKLKIANEDFKAVVIKDINDLKEELKEYLKKGFECPVKENGKYEVFNTDAGAVQAILGAIVADYCSIGDNETGYEYVNKVYSCPDKKSFILSLKKDFKLK